MKKHMALQVNKSMIIPKIYRGFLNFLFLIKKKIKKSPIADRHVSVDGVHVQCKKPI